MRQQRYVTGLLSLAAVALLAVPALGDIATFQNGANGYSGAKDTSIRWAFASRKNNCGNGGVVANGECTGEGTDFGAYESWSTNGGNSTVLEVGSFLNNQIGFAGGFGPTIRYSRMIVRFKDVFGDGAGQVPAGSPINSATLTLHATEDLGADGANSGVVDRPATGQPPKLNSGPISIHPMLVSTTFGTSDGTGSKGETTGGQRKRGSIDWGQSCGGLLANSTPRGDPKLNGKAPDATRLITAEIDCGPLDGTDYDSGHAGSVVDQMASGSGAHSYDVTGMLQELVDTGLFITSRSKLDANGDSTNGGRPAVNSDGINLANLNEGDTVLESIPSYSNSAEAEFNNYGTAYFSSEAGDQSMRPMLTIDFVPEPATLSLLAIGGMLALKRRRA